MHKIWPIGCGYKPQVVWLTLLLVWPAGCLTGSACKAKRKQPPSLTKACLFVLPQRPNALHPSANPQEKLPWSEEVLVSKAELEERRSHVAELEQQVAELTMQTEYQLRLKDLHVQVRVTAMQLLITGLHRLALQQEVAWHCTAALDSNDSWHENCCRVKTTGGQE